MQIRPLSQTRSLIKLESATRKIRVGQGHMHHTTSTPHSPSLSSPTTLPRLTGHTHSKTFPLFQSPCVSVNEGKQKVPSMQLFLHHPHKFAIMPRNEFSPTAFCYAVPCVFTNATLQNNDSQEGYNDLDRENAIIPPHSLPPIPPITTIFTPKHPFPRL